VALKHQSRTVALEIGIELQAVRPEMEKAHRSASLARVLGMDGEGVGTVGGGGTHRQWDVLVNNVV